MLNCYNHNGAMERAFGAVLEYAESRWMGAGAITEQAMEGQSCGCMYPLDGYGLCNARGFSFCFSCYMLGAWFFIA